MCCNYVIYRSIMLQRVAYNPLVLSNHQQLLNGMVHIKYDVWPYLKIIENIAAIRWYSQVVYNPCFSVDKVGLFVEIHKRILKKSDWLSCWMIFDPFCFGQSQFLQSLSEMRPRPVIKVLLTLNDSNFPTALQNRICLLLHTVFRAYNFQLLSLWFTPDNCFCRS